MIRVDVATDDSQFLHLKPHWNSLLAKSRANGIFQTWEYTREWWRIFGGPYDLRILTAYDESGEIRGIAPLVTGPGHTLGRRAVRHLSFLGQLSDSAADYCDFMVEAGYEERMMAAFSRHLTTDLAKDWGLLYLPASRSDSRCISLLQAHLAQAGFQPNAIHPRPAPFVELPGSWEAFLQSKSRNMRKKIKRSMTKLEERFDVRVLSAGVDLDPGKALESMVALNRKRWGQEAMSFHTGEFSRFHQRLTHRFHEKGWLSLKILALDGVHAAAQYDFVYGNKVWGFQGGWDPDFARLKVAEALTAYALRGYIEAGLKEYDFLAGEAEYKSHWSSGKRQVHDVELVNPVNVPAQVFGMARRVKTFVKRRMAEPEIAA